MTETKRVRAICDLLTTIRLGQDDTWEEVCRELRVLIDSEQVWAFQVKQTSASWRMTRWCAVGEPEGVGRAFADTLESSPGEWAWFRPSCPDPAQRNRVVEALSASTQSRPGYFEASEVFAKVFHPYRLHQHRQLRVLVCDDDRLLGWFGALQPTDCTPRQTTLLEALVPSVRRRMMAEHQLESAGSLAHSLEAVIGEIEKPALVLKGCRVVHANLAAASLLASGGNDLLERCERAKHEPVPDIDLIPIGEGLTIAIIRQPKALGVVSSRVAVATERWKLSPRTAEVLAHVVEGRATATIAEILGISTRAVEIHITRLFDRAGVDCRAALVACVLGD